MRSSREIKVAALASTLALGGAERQLAALARGLRNRGYRFSFFLLRDAGAVGTELRGDGFDVDVKIMNRPARWLGAVGELRDYDLVVALDHNNVLKLLPAFNRRLPQYVVLYHLQGKPPGGWLRALGGAAAVVAVAESQLALLREAGVGSARVVANGVAVPPAATAADRRLAREGLGLPADAVVAAAVSRLSPEKGVDVFLEALASAAEGRRPFLAVAGDGPERPRLERFARANLGGRFAFLGELDDVSPVYRAADLFVLPSRRESAPLALLEAMAHGLAAVAAAVGDVPAMLSGGAGVTFAPGSSEELGRAIIELAAEPAKRLEMGAAARAAVARRYDLGRMLDEYDALFAELWGENKADVANDG
jgi:glycosyltransferase involved in cell wall biosynthesis